MFGFGIAIDGLGNVLCTGWFETTVDFDPNAGVANLTVVGTQDIFILKLDASGNYVWVKAIGSSTFDMGTGIAIGPSNSIYLQV